MRIAPSQKNMPRPVIEAEAVFILQLRVCDYDHYLESPSNEADPLVGYGKWKQREIRKYQESRCHLCDPVAVPPAQSDDRAKHRKQGVQQIQERR
jgi:hypothetical protein